MTSNDDYLLEILLENGAVTHDLIKEVRDSFLKEGESVIDTLINRGILPEAEILATLARQLGMEIVSLKDVNISPEVRDMIPVETARQYKVVPLYKVEDTLTVALSDPLDFNTLDRLRYMLKCNIEGVIALRDEVQVSIDKYYSSEVTMESMLDQLTEGTVDLSMSGADDLLSEGGGDSDAPIIKLVSVLILEAYRSRASDIHLEPMEKTFRVRYRIDGVLHEVDSPPKRLQPAIISRVKIMSGMKISEKRIPQDGRIQVNILGRDLDLRVSTVPSNHGETIVMRILDSQNLALGLPKLGFFSDDQQVFERLISLPDGILLVTGPTGSGKSTTLYACLGEINKPDRKIITVENPVEYQMSGVNQVQVRADIGLTFSAALRSILRQSPNVVMIGEIRDSETAQIATEAALTGHLVFSTLHTNDAPGAVTRLLDIGIKPFLVASSLRAAVAQRLVRCICDNCREQYDPDEESLRMLMSPPERASEVQLSRGRGCSKCNLSGFYSRKGVFEMFLVTPDIQKMIFAKATATSLRRYARECGMRSLREDGLRKAIAGITTLEEVMRVTMGDVN